MKCLVTACTALLLVSGCARDLPFEYSTETPGMALLPISKAGLVDGRARFREIYCAANAAHGRELPDYRPCDDVLVRLPGEDAPEGEPVHLGDSRAPLTMLIVPGVGWNCIKQYVDSEHTATLHVERFGYTIEFLDVGALSSSAHNARMIRDAVMAMPADENRLVLIGYSKGAADILEAVVDYPELGQRVSAVVSAAGAIGGSPLANLTPQERANLLEKLPGADCLTGDEGAVESLKTTVRRRWLATHSLPESIRYYSLVTYPEPEQISLVLKPAYNELSRIDPRNDSQLLYYDQIIPGSVVMGFVNADHWAIVVPVDRSHAIISKTIVTRNDFPREILAESILRFVEEDLVRRPVEVSAPRVFGQDLVEAPGVDCPEVHGDQSCS